jgi:hypothetical protein
MVFLLIKFFAEITCQWITVTQQLLQQPHFHPSLCPTRAWGLLSILGLRSPLKFTPVFLMQLFYKSAWFIGVALPLWATGHFPSYAIPTVIIFATFIVGDLIAIPFSYVFAKEPKQ